MGGDNRYPAGRLPALVTHTAEGCTATASGPAPQAIPLSYHCLPLSVTTDLVTAYDAKHVLDFTPTPLNLATELAKRGISYFAVCGTEAQKTFLEQALHNGLIKELVDSNSPLGDARFIQEVDAAGACCQEMVPEPSKAW